MEVIKGHAEDLQMGQWPVMIYVWTANQGRNACARPPAPHFFPCQYDQHPIPSVADTYARLPESCTRASI